MVGYPAAMSTPAASLPFTGVPEADELLARDPMALLIGFALDQQVSVQKAFGGPLELRRRIGTLEAAAIAAMAPGDLEAAFTTRPALHRFPGAMARRVQELCAVIVERYGGEASRIWREAAMGRILEGRLLALPGIGAMKTRSLIAVLGKRLGLELPRLDEVMPHHPTLGDVDFSRGARGLPGPEAGIQGATQGGRNDRARSVTTSCPPALTGSWQPCYPGVQSTPEVWLIEWSIPATGMTGTFGAGPTHGPRRCRRPRMDPGDEQPRERAPRGQHLFRHSRRLRHATGRERVLRCRSRPRNTLSTHAWRVGRAILGRGVAQAPAASRSAASRVAAAGPGRPSPMDRSSRRTMGMSSRIDEEVKASSAVARSASVYQPSSLP